MSNENTKITKDIAVPLGETENGGLMIARIQGTDERPTRAMVGELRPLQDGVPVMGEVVKLTKDGEAPHYKVETLVEDPFKAERERARSSGRTSTTYSFPSQKYQENWASIFRKKPDPSELN